NGQNSAFFSSIYAEKKFCGLAGEIPGGFSCKNAKAQREARFLFFCGELKRVPIKTNTPIPKCKIFEAMKLLDKLEKKARVNCGEVVLQDICRTGSSLYRRGVCSKCL
ncbi:MAG: DUF1667 domain-containing protein, partial [Spirochaetaceae bacterium]|nr:DUF1667 domain-containing protein [Spirochaetaceae bacterium]